MPGWPRIRQAASAAATTLTTTTETVLVTSPGISTDGPSQQISIQATAALVTGASTTSVRLRIRRGTGITGTVVGDSGNITAAAAAAVDLSVDAVDNPGDVADQVYVLTAQQVAATGNATAQLAAIAAVIAS